MNPTVTIGLPISGQLPYFEAAIRSVFAQTRDDWQLHILCDGAPPEVVRRVMTIVDHRVRVDVGDRTEGLAIRLNEIASSCTSPLLCRMDADDVMDPCRLEVQAGLFESMPGLEVLGSHAYLIDEGSELQGLFTEPPLPREPHNFLKSNALTHPTVMFRADWARSNPYDPNYVLSQDKELWLRTGPRTSMLKIDQPLLFYRVESNLSRAKHRRMSQYDRKVLRAYAPDLVGSTAAKLMISQSLAKELTFSAAVAVGAQRWLYARKSSDLPEHQIEPAKKALMTSVSTLVPGWD